jgi:uncharacterized membrane protein
MGESVPFTEMVVLRRAFGGASIVWASALPLASLAASRPALPAAVYLLTLTVYAIGSVICHQRPERSFYLWSHQMPVCARCTGIYAGAALAVLLSLGGRRLLPGVSRSPRVVALVALAPTIATLVYEWTTGVMPSNWIRAASGVCLGIGVASLIQREVN